MKKFVFFSFFVMVLSAFITPIALGLSSRLSKDNHGKRNFEAKGEKLYIKVFNADTSKNEFIELEEYLPGVVAAEMPAAFELEALKAQAVAARSYILSKMETSSAAHPDAIVCNNPNHCKAHISESSAKARWGQADFDRYWNKILTAVSETDGEYMVCGEDIVEAFFFAKSGGRTENSEDVWGESRPYLKSVASEENYSDSEFYSYKEVSFNDFRKTLQTLNSSFAQGSFCPQISKITHTQGGSVDTIIIDGQSFRGTQIRSAFGLKSANFEILLSDKTVTFKVCGYGHGVGMSQSGANQMAKRGENYTEILSHYYTNIQIIKL